MMDKKRSEICKHNGVIMCELNARTIWSVMRAKRSEAKHRSGCPNASSGISMQTSEKSLQFFPGNVRCRNQCAARVAHSIWAFIPIHVVLPVSSFPFSLSLLSQAVTEQFYSSSCQTVTSIPKPYTEVHGINHSH